MLASREAGVADGVGVGVALCADKSAVATTVNAKAKHKLIRFLPKTPPIRHSGSKTALFGKRKILFNRPLCCRRDLILGKELAESHQEIPLNARKIAHGAGRGIVHKRRRATIGALPS